MNIEMKMKIIVNLLLWLPVVWLVWNQIYKIRMARKRIRILDRDCEILCQYNKAISNPKIDNQNNEAITLRRKAKRIWDSYLKSNIEYDRLVEQM